MHTRSHPPIQPHTPMHFKCEKCREQSRGNKVAKYKFRLGALRQVKSSTINTNNLSRENGMRVLFFFFSFKCVGLHDAPLFLV